MFFISYKFHDDSSYHAGKKETNHGGSPVLRKKVKHVQILLFLLVLFRITSLKVSL